MTETYLTSILEINSNNQTGMKRIFVYSILSLAFTMSCIAQEIYKTKSYSAQQRAEDLAQRLTLEEKVGLMMDASGAVERLGIKPYNWWNEALHGVARAGLATVFPQPIGMAASFDPSMLFRVFEAVSDEARAKNTHAASQDSYNRYQGLTVWTPTINIFRDPRWGRGIETYGEDPYLTSVMGVAVVKALQGPENGKYDKLHACAKHFAVHSGPEWNRHSFDAKNIKARDLYETYLPPFEALVKEAKVKEVMCAYNRFEGAPCCGSEQLLMEILRGDWGFDGIVVADCGAIADFYVKGRHETHHNGPLASADAVSKGTDLDCGSSYRHLIESVKEGYISEKDIDISVIRLLKARFELGEMDNLSDVSWSQIPYSVVASNEHDKLSLEMARKSMTLLLNKNNILPLKRGGLTVAVMGPNANDSVMQWGNYNGTPKHTITILEGIKSALGENDKLIYEKACGLVEKTLFESVFNNCISENGQGFSAEYWNNMARQGTPVVRSQINTPFHFCTSGATVFAPGVNLTDFAATYHTTFTPEQSGEVFFDFYSCGQICLTMDGKEIAKFRNNHGSRKAAYKTNVEKGKSYNIRIDFEYSMGDAQLDFDLGFKKEITIQKSIDRVKDADVVIFAGGISPLLEGEEMGVNLPGFRAGDRTEIELPEVQRELIEALYKAGKKVIFVNCSGSPIAMEPEIEHCEAILQAWYPGQAGGKAVADVLFGEYNPAGRLPVTFYKNMSQLPDFEDYNMTGRTYRYMTEEPLFPFGYGLSYTTFNYGVPKLNKEQINLEETLTITVPVGNQGPMDGEEVIQVYLKKKNDPEGPNKALRAFKRINIPAGKTVDVVLSLSGKQFEWWNPAQNAMQICAADFELFVGSNSSDKDLQKLNFTIKAISD
jgi:beta-glucosidase